MNPLKSISVACRPREHFTIYMEAGSSLRTALEKPAVLHLVSPFWGGRSQRIRGSVPLIQFMYTKGSITNTGFVCLFVFPNLESQKNLGGEVSRQPCLEVCTPELDLVVWGCVQLKVESPHRWRSATFLGPVPWLCRSCGQEVLPDIQIEVALLRLGPCGFLSFSLHL